MLQDRELPELRRGSTLARHELKVQQRSRLLNILYEPHHITGQLGFPTLDTRLNEFVLSLRQNLASAGIAVCDVRLMGSAASYVVRDLDQASEPPESAHYSAPYNDLDVVFTVDFDPRPSIAAAKFDVIWLAVMESLRGSFPPGEQDNAARILPQALSAAYVMKMVKVPHAKAIVNKGHDCWSLLSLRNDHGGPSLELKFVQRMRRQCEFSMDSIQVVLSDDILRYSLGRCEEDIPKVHALCVYGDFQEAVRHINERIIYIRAPEQLRGGGLLKYCRLLADGFRHAPMSQAELDKLQRSMCTRFFIDFGSVHEQHNTLVSYMHAHFPDPDKAVVYLDHFIRVVTQTTRANPGERSNTLKMVKYLRESIRTAIDPTNGAADPPQEASAPLAIAVQNLVTPALRVNSVPPSPPSSPRPMRHTQPVSADSSPAHPIRISANAGDVDLNFVRGMGIGSSPPSSGGAMAQFSNSGSSPKSTYSRVTAQPSTGSRSSALPEPSGPRKEEMLDVKSSTAHSYLTPPDTPEMYLGLIDSQSGKEQEPSLTSPADSKAGPVAEAVPDSVHPPQCSNLNPTNDNPGLNVLGEHARPESPIAASNANPQFTDEEREEVFHNCRTALVTTDDPNPIRAQLRRGLIDVNDFGYFGNDRSVGQSLLMVASKYGRKRCIAELVDSFGADVNKAGGVGNYTALHYAAFHGHIAAVRALLERGARTDVHSSEGETPHQAAMAKGNVDIACMIASYSMGESDWKSVPVKRGMNRRRSSFGHANASHGGVRPSIQTPVAGSPAQSQQSRRGTNQKGEGNVTRSNTTRRTLTPPYTTSEHETPAPARRRLPNVLKSRCTFI